MLSTNIDFRNRFTPTVITLGSLPGSGSVIYRNQDSYAVFVNVPASYESAYDIAQNPTTELLDRLGELKKRYSRPFIIENIPPSDLAFENARDFVLTLPLNQIAKPSIHVAADGEVNFQWMGSDFQIDLGFYGDGKFSFYGAKQGYTPVIGDEIPVKDGIPKDLVNFASAV